MGYPHGYGNLHFGAQFEGTKSASTRCHQETLPFRTPRRRRALTPLPRSTLKARLMRRSTRLSCWELDAKGWAGCITCYNQIHLKKRLNQLESIRSSFPKSSRPNCLLIQISSNVHFLKDYPPRSAKGVDFSQSRCESKLLLIGPFFGFS